MANIEKRKTKEGEITYRVKIRLRGHPTQTASFKRLTDARKWEQQTEAAIREGRHFITSESKRHTLAEAIDRYVLNILPKETHSYQLSKYNWWKKKLGHLVLADVTPAILASCRDELSKEKTQRKRLREPATVNRYLAALSSMFTVAIREWGWLEDNPIRKIGKLKEPEGRDRFLSDEERKRLLAACEGKALYLKLLAVLGISVGARRND